MGCNPMLLMQQQVMVQQQVQPRTRSHCTPADSYSMSNSATSVPSRQMLMRQQVMRQQAMMQKSRC